MVVDQVSFIIIVLGAACTIVLYLDYFVYFSNCDLENP